LNKQRHKPWSGRFQGTTDELMERFNASISFDRKLLEVDVIGSKVYALALQRAGVLTEAECIIITEGLEGVLVDMSAGSFVFDSRFEDVHMAVEAQLIKSIGPLGGKLHTGRSRNDQVNLDERLYLREAVASVRQQIRSLQAAIVESAQQQADVILPGYTHLQQAQPILFSHYALALFWMLQRDSDRLADAWKRADFLPLGSGALAGSAYPLDRQFMASELGFSGVTPNSIDAVSDRDFLLEALAAVAILMMHLSRYCEDLVIWSTAEFGFIELSDAFSTGSSMMPQKKNPDSLELIRGKTGRVYGNLTALLTLMKGLALTYSKDLQEDKEPFFDSFETVGQCLDVFTGAWSTMSLRTERMKTSVDTTALATDLADYLVKRGVPFRDAHHVVGQLVGETLAAGKTLTSLGLDDFKRFSDQFEADVLNQLDLERSLELRNIPGGTGPAAVQEQLRAARNVLSSDLK